jgi:hypothetical protein
MNAKWHCCLGELGLKHGKWLYKVVYDLSKVEKLDLHKNGGNG